MKIYFVRHGQKECTGFKHTSISKEGAEQAKHFAKYAKTLGLKKIYASPYVRTRETAAIVGKILEMPIHESETVKELGIIKYLQLAIHSLITNRPPKYQEAFFNELKDLARKADGDILIISHSGFLRFMKALMARERCEKLKSLFSLYYNLGVTTLEFNGELKIIEYNKADFLPEKLRSTLPY